MAVPGFGGMINSPAALDPILAIQLRFYRAWEAAYTSNPAYTDFTQFAFEDSPAGDLINVIYSEPLQGMREWLDARPMSQVNWNYFTQAVRIFADGMEIDLDDVKPDSGNPAKLAMYMESAERLGEATALLWPQVIVDAVNNALTKNWLPDGQPIWSTHPFNPRITSLGSFQNYFANNANGGNASFPLTYANLLARLKAGYAFKLPNGKPWPIRYTHLVVPPTAYPLAVRLCTYDKLPVGEIWGQNIATSSAGGEAKNEVMNTYGVKPLQLFGLGVNQWMLVDASTPSMRGVAIKKRQPVTWQYLGPGAGAGAIGNPDNDSGAVPEHTFERNKTKWGPKARGDGFFRNWWGQVLCDGT